ncbi:glutathione S-transferase omega-1-like [Paramacrobiotus metropolitanus]|uniref:glutathione S-transferase omega-1-like n=1 Tax=Paramacrobiotus metropolitanus TaxID=2943436 RepID=UPI0024460BA9|nr:glutathione S-transferase omega-1-like [Paramacrobiotus metropolitanus]
MTLVRDHVPALRKGSSKPQDDSSKITVYSVRGSPYCQRIRLLMNVLHIPMRIVNVHIWDKPEWFVGLTPFSKVPSITDTDSRSLCESLTIAEYVDNKYGNGKHLLPKDNYLRAQQKILVERIMLLVGDPVREVAFKATKEAGEELLRRIEKAQELLEDDYFAGKEMGFVDIMVYPWFDRSPAYLRTVGVDINTGNTKAIMAWRERMLTNPAVTGSSYSDAFYTAILEGRRKGKPDPDVGMDL